MQVASTYFPLDVWRLIGRCTQGGKRVLSLCDLIILKRTCKQLYRCFSELVNARSAEQHQLWRKDGFTVGLNGIVITEPGRYVLRQNELYKGVENAAIRIHKVDDVEIDLNYRCIHSMYQTIVEITTRDDHPKAFRPRFFIHGGTLIRFEKARPLIEPSLETLSFVVHDIIERVSDHYNPYWSTRHMGHKGFVGPVGPVGHIGNDGKSPVDIHNIRAQQKDQQVKLRRTPVNHGKSNRRR